MRFLLDANLPRSAIDAVNKSGHQAEFAHDVGLGTSPDVQIAARVRQSGAALITRDLDFSDVRQYPPQEYAGIVVLRLPDHYTATEIAAVLVRFLAERHFVEKLPGRLAIVDENRVRFRPPLGTNGTH
jgi:predicted nuclease of predicted toxin-antitoxin system